MKIFVNTSKSYNVLDKEPYITLISKIKGFDGAFDNQQITLKWPNDVNATVIKTSVGTANSVNISCVTNLVNTINIPAKLNGYEVKNLYNGSYKNIFSNDD